MKSPSPLFPWQANGHLYFTAPSGERHCTGTMMGRVEYHPKGRAKLHLRRVRLSQGYDQGGAYWGLPSNLFCAWGNENLSGETVVLWQRGPSREQVKKTLAEKFPQVSFYR